MFPPRHRSSLDDCVDRQGGFVWWVDSTRKWSVAGMR